MPNLKNIFDYINRYGIKTLTITAHRRFLRKIESKILKKMIERGKVARSRFLDKTNLEDVKRMVFNMSSLPFTENIKIIKGKKLFQTEIKYILAEADKTCKNEFDILGSGWVKWEKDGNIDWHRDKKSGYCWDKHTWYNNIKYGDKEGVDVKVPWELSRFQFLFALYFSYVYSGKQEYLFKIKDSIVNWIDENPPYFGVNWACTMDVAIRIANWSLILYSLKREILEDSIFFEKFLNSLYLHLIFIRKNLENLSFFNSNHYLSDIAGFYTANLLFPVFKRNHRWLKWVSGQLMKEIENQVYRDGGNFESSTSYHRLVTELFFLPGYLSRIRGTDHFSQTYEDKLRGMFFYLLHLLKPNGKIIQFGDNDSGRFFKLFNRPSLEVNYMISLAYGMFKDNEFCLKDIPFDILAFIFWGEKIFDQYTSGEKEKKTIINLKSRAYKESGVYILRNEKFYVAVSCMPNGQKGNGGHCHNDKLSFEMNYKGIDIIVDPGTFVYTPYPEERNRFRSTYYHNTIQIDNLEQNNFAGSLFRINEEAVVLVHRFTPDLIECSHNGFEKKGEGIHSRKIILFEERLLIDDQLNPGKEGYSYLHFAPGIDIDTENGNRGFSIRKNTHNLLLIDIENEISVNISDYNYSPGYGQVISARKMVIRFDSNLKIRFQESQVG